MLIACATLGQIPLNGFCFTIVVYKSPTPTMGSLANSGSFTVSTRHLSTSTIPLSAHSSINKDSR